MNILILHRVPYYKIEYHRGIDHDQHTVVYIGAIESLQNIPENIRCKKVLRPGKGSVFSEVSHYLDESQIHFDRIISMSEYELLIAAALRERFNIFGATTEDVELVRNKIKMKSAIKKYGILTPEFYSLIDFYKQPHHLLTGKVVLKPIDGASSENIKIFNSAYELKKALETSATSIDELDHDKNTWPRYEVEEFIDGEIIHIDGLVNEGKLIICLASQYVGTCLDYANGHPLGSIQIETTETLKVWTQRCLSATKISQGSFHLEAIVSKDKIVFLEIANRVGGADVVKTFELATKIHLPSAELKFLIGEKFIKPISSISHKIFGWFVYPGHHLASGFAELQHTEEFQSHPNMLEWHSLKKHQRCRQNITYQPTEVPIAGVVSGESSDELIKFMRTMFARMKVSNKNITKRMAS